MAEKKPETKVPENVILMPVSDVAEWDDEARLKSSPPVDWPYSGMSEEEAFAEGEKVAKESEKYREKT